MVPSDDGGTLPPAVGGDQLARLETRMAALHYFAHCLRRKHLAHRRRRGIALGSTRSGHACKGPRTRTCGGSSSSPSAGAGRSTVSKRKVDESGAPCGRWASTIRVLWVREVISATLSDILVQAFRQPDWWREELVRLGKLLGHRSRFGRRLWAMSGARLASAYRQLARAAGPIVRRRPRRLRSGMNRSTFGGHAVKHQPKSSTNQLPAKPKRYRSLAAAAALAVVIPFSAATPVLADANFPSPRATPISPAS